MVNLDIIKSYELHQRTLSNNKKNEDKLGGGRNQETNMLNLK